MNLKRNMTKLCSALLALLMLCLAALPAGAVRYPEGVTAQTAAQSVGKTDNLIKNAVPALTGKSFSAFLFGTLYSDETLSAILKGIYTAVEEQGAALSGFGLDTSPANAARGLSAYPSVQRRVAAASSWESLDLSGVYWNVTNKSSFAAAVSAMGIPFNDLLYTLLCGGTYQAGLMTLHGDNGYRDGMIPILQALGCPSIPSDTAFRAAADSNRTMMLYQIALSLLSLCDAIAAAPMTKLCATLPDLAIFVRDGGLEHAVDVLLSPLSSGIGPLGGLLTGTRMLKLVMFLKNPASLTRSFADNVTGSVNEMMEKSGVSLAEIDLNALASCKGSGGACLVEVLRWGFETVKRNRGKLTELMPGGSEALTAPLLSRSADELCFIVIHLLNSTETMPLLYQWSRYGFNQVKVNYTKKLGKKEFKRVLAGIDDVIGEFTAEFSGGDVKTALADLIYSSATVTAVCKALYGAFSGEGTAAAAAALGLPGSPAALAGVLPSGYRSAKNVLWRYASWDHLKSVPWGVTAGDRASFQRALTAAMRPLRPLLQGLLANDTIPLFGALHLPGSNGYNTGVIPLLEALSCPDDEIKTYVDYCKGKGTDAILTDLLRPLLSLLDRFVERPVYTITAILPNLAYRIVNGEVTQCVRNLLYPLLETLRQFGYDPAQLGLDLSAETAPDLSSLLSGVLTELPMELDLSTLDLASIAGMGTLVTRESKRVTGGKTVHIDDVKAEKTAVLVTLLRWVIDQVRNPENGDLMGSLMQSGDMPETFKQFSAGLSQQFADMTTDETIEWLYQLFFRERAKKQLPRDDGYEPHVIYEPESHALRNTLIAVGCVLLVGGAVVFWRRRDLRRWLEQRKQKKSQKEA